MVKLYSFALSLLAASAVAGASEVDQDSRSLSLRGDIIGINDRIMNIQSVEDLENLGIEVTIVDGNGSRDALDELLRGGKMSIKTGGDVDGGGIIDPATPIGELAGPDEEESQRIERAVGEGGRRLQSGICPSLTKTGIANNSCITVRVRDGSGYFEYRLCCGETCCPRSWKCKQNADGPGGTCSISCSSNIIEVNTFLFEEGQICCSVAGRIVSTSEYSSERACFDRSLCAA